VIPSSRIRGTARESERESGIRALRHGAVEVVEEIAELIDAGSRAFARSGVNIDRCDERDVLSVNGGVTADTMASRSRRISGSPP